MVATSDTRKDKRSEDEPSKKQHDTKLNEESRAKKSSWNEFDIMEQVSVATDSRAGEAIR